jgi:hypothetical protein
VSSGPPVVVRLADVDEVVARWRAAQPGPTAAPPPPPPVVRRPWWRRRRSSE